MYSFYKILVPLSCGNGRSYTRIHMMDDLRIALDGMFEDTAKSFLKEFNNAEDFDIDLDEVDTWEREDQDPQAQAAMQAAAPHELTESQVHPFTNLVKQVRVGGLEYMGRTSEIISERLFGAPVDDTEV